MDLWLGETSVALNEAISVVLLLDLVYKRIPEVVENFSKLKLQIEAVFERFRGLWN